MTQKDRLAVRGMAKSNAHRCQERRPHGHTKADLVADIMRALRLQRGNLLITETFSGLSGMKITGEQRGALDLFLKGFRCCTCLFLSPPLFVTCTDESFELSGIPTAAASTGRSGFRVDFRIFLGVLSLCFFLFVRCCPCVSCLSALKSCFDDRKTQGEDESGDI